MSAAQALTAVDRRKHVRARAGAIVLDTLLLAYAAWCLQFLAVHFGISGPFLSCWPLLLLLAPVGALLWQTRGASLGQAGYQQRLVTGGGAPADLDQRALVALVGTLQWALIAAPLVLIPTTGLAVLLSAALLLACLGLGLMDPRARSLGERLAQVESTLRPIPETQAPKPWRRRFNAWLVLGILVLTVAVAWITTEVRPGALFSGWDRTKHMIKDLFQPDWSVAPLVIDLIVETVFLALMASTLALPVAFFLSFLGARNVMTGTPTGRVVYSIARFLMNFTRSVEPIIQVIIFVLWVGIGPFAGMLALFVHSVASLSKLYSEAIESIDPGPVEALRATGASPLHVIRFGIVPQVIPPFLSFTMYRWDINVRMATILGFVGGGGIGQMLNENTQLGVWPKIGVIVVFITLVVWLMDIASSKARERLL